MQTIRLTGGIVVSMDADHAVFDPGVVDFCEGVITFVGSVAKAPKPPVGSHIINVAERIVMPGLVNTHTHTGMSYFRNLLEDLSSPAWFEREQIAERYLSSTDAYWAALLGTYEMLRQGVTTIADRFSHADQVAAALQHAGIRAILAPSLVNHDSANRKRQTLALIEQYGTDGTGLLTIGLGPVGPDTCDTELLQWVRQQADKQQALIFIHLAQSRQELAEIKRRGYDGAANYLDAIGLLGADVIAAHGMYFDAAEINLLAKRDVRIAHCPASNAKIEGRVAPISAMLTAGIKVGLGTDCAASNNAMDMFSEMKTAGLLNKVQAQEPTVLPVKLVLELATSRAAICLHLADQIGSLEPGKRADIITLEQQQPWLQPWHDIYAGLVYSCRGLDVRDVWVDGIQRVAQGQLLAADVPEVIQRATAWVEHYRRATESLKPTQPKPV